MYLLVPYSTFYVLNNTFPHVSTSSQKRHISCQLSETETQTAGDDTDTVSSTMRRRNLICVVFS